MLTKTTVPVMHEHVTTKSHCSKIINTACPIGYIAHNDGKSRCKSGVIDKSCLRTDKELM